MRKQNGKDYEVASIQGHGHGQPIPISGMGLITGWRTYQLAQSLSTRTVTERTAAVLRLGSWLGTDPAAATTEQLMEWLAAHDDWSHATRATYFGHLRAFYGYLHRQGLRADDPTALLGKPKRPRAIPHPISDEHLPRLLATSMWKTTRTMILLAALAGLRVHEIAKVRGESVDLEGMTLRVKGKGGHVATLPLHPLLADEAKGYPRSGWWFPSPTREGRPILGQSVSNRITEVMRRAGVPGSAHSLRHWFGTTLVDGGADLRVAQELLRHQSLATTQIYVQTSDRRKVEGIEGLDPWRAGGGLRAA